MFKDIFYGQFAAVRRDEWPRALLLSAFFFLVIATFWILKPVKRGVIINYFGEDPFTFLGMVFSGAEAEQIGKVLNVFAVYAVVVLFTWLARKYSRRHLVLIFATVFSALFILYATVIDQLNDWVVWSFYVYGDMFNTAMVVLFWAFTNDIMTADEARRTYFIVGLGGVVGGFVGATVVNASVEAVGRDTLLLICVVPMVLVVVVAYLADRQSRREGTDAQGPAAPESSSGVAWEGAKLVVFSRYLLALAALIVLYELVSNVVDFQLASVVEQVIEEDLEKDEFFAFIGQITGVGSIVIQLLMTGYVMQRYGVRTALLFLPAAILLGATGFLLVPGLFFAGAMSASDNALNYSINQSAREALYTPTSADVKYKAKAFIDMFLQRFAKVLSVVVNLLFVALFAAGVRWLSLIVIAMIGAWIYVVLYLGRRFEERAALQEEWEEPAAT